MKQNEFNRLFMNNRPALTRFAVRLTRNKQDAEELVQETFCLAAEKLQTYTHKERLLSWLFTLARRLWLNFLRKQQQLHYISSDQCKQSHTPAFADTRFLPDKELLLKPIEQHVRDILKRMPEIFRTPLILHRLEGLRYSDIGAIEGVKIGTVRSRINRAAKYFKKEFNQRTRGESPFYRPLFSLYPEQKITDT